MRLPYAVWGPPGGPNVNEFQLNSWTPKSAGALVRMFKFVLKAFNVIPIVAPDNGRRLAAGLGKVMRAASYKMAHPQQCRRRWARLDVLPAEQAARRSVTHGVTDRPAAPAGTK